MLQTRLRRLAWGAGITFNARERDHITTLFGPRLSRPQYMHPHAALSAATAAQGRPIAIGPLAWRLTLHWSPSSSAASGVPRSATPKAELIAIALRRIPLEVHANQLAIVKEGAR